ncbi:hypothetical protein ACWCXX_06290 [Streptomyces sp. NPDC001732]
MKPVRGREYFDMAALPLVFAAASELLEADIRSARVTKVDRTAP